MTKAALIKENEQLRRELADAQEQQTSTAEILRVISRSPRDIQLKLETVAQNAARVCAARAAIIRRVEGFRKLTRSFLLPGPAYANNNGCD